MAKFNERMRWTTYGEGGFADKSSLTLDDENGNQLTGVIRAPRGGFIALSAVTGGVLGRAEEFDAAVMTAEAEALDPSNP